MTVFFLCRIGQFLNDAQRHVGTANEAYTLYVVERFEVCISNIRTQKIHLSQNEETVPTDVREILNFYQSNFTELL